MITVKELAIIIADEVGWAAPSTAELPFDYFVDAAEGIMQRFEDAGIMKRIEEDNKAKG